MTQELSVQSLGDVVKDKVRKAMFESLPDEAVGKLIQAEFSKFFEDQKRNSYSSELDPSQFKMMIRQQIQELMKERVIAMLRDKVNTYLDGVNVAPNGTPYNVGALFEEMAPHVLKGIMSEISYKCVMNLQNNLR